MPQGGALDLGQAKPRAEAAKLKKFGNAGGIAEDSGCPTPAGPIFELRAV